MEIKVIVEVVVTAVTTSPTGQVIIEVITHFSA